MISWNIRTSCKKIKWGWRAKSCQRDNGLMTSWQILDLKKSSAPVNQRWQLPTLPSKMDDRKLFTYRVLLFFLLWILMHLIEREKKKLDGKNQMDIPHPWLRVILFSSFFFPHRRMHCFDFNVFNRNVRTFSISWYINNGRGGGSVFTWREVFTRKIGYFATDKSDEFQMFVFL